MKYFISLFFLFWMTVAAWGQSVSDELKAAEQGDAIAQYKMAVYYFAGKVVPKDMTKAVMWLRKATDQGYHEAELLLGVCYTQGDGVAEDERQAFYWFKKAAMHGNAQAQLFTGSCFKNGYGVTKDDSQACYWYKKAAIEGNAEAQYELGKAYMNGEGVEKDYNSALDWLTKSVWQGYSASAALLGVLLENGSSDEKSLDYALYFYKQALGDEKYINGLEPSQLLLLQDLAKNLEDKGAVPRRPPLTLRDTGDTTEPNSQSTQKEETLVTNPSVMPSFPGGLVAMLKYLNKHIVYPKKARDEGYQGRVVARIVVETDGSISNVEILRSVESSIDAEAIRVIKSMPRWNPGKLNGKPVKTQYTVPVTFHLN